MSLLDFLKRKKEIEKVRSVEKTKKVSVVKKNEKKEAKEKIKPIFVKAPAGKVKDFSYDMVKEPHISEKATNIAGGNQYVFKVIANSNKTEIKKSVEGIYGVNVLSVNIIKIPAKKRRIGRTQGFKKGYTKAVIRIADGQKIEIL